MFSQDETNFLIGAIDDQVKKGGLQSAQMGIVVALKLQNALKEQNELEAATHPNTKPRPKPSKPKPRANGTEKTEASAG